MWKSEPPTKRDRRKPSKRPKDAFGQEAKTKPAVKPVNIVRTDDYVGIREEVSANLKRDARREPE